MAARLRQGGEMIRQAYSTVETTVSPIWSGFITMMNTRMSTSTFLTISLTIGIFFMGSILLCLLCFRAIPREAFVDGSGGATEDDTALMTEITAAEEAVCKLITRVDGFILNDVGPAGQKDPGLVTAAQSKAREGVDMVACPVSSTGAEGHEPVDAAHRITRLEETLRAFTAPELQRTYDTAMKCEGFASGSDAADLRTRLTAVQATLQDQQKRLLAPIDQKTADLHKGIASDCDKRRGAAHMTPAPAKK
jgi:hypothetical protein